MAVVMVNGTSSCKSIINKPPLILLNFLLNWKIISVSAVDKINPLNVIKDVRGLFTAGCARQFVNPLCSWRKPARGDSIFESTARRVTLLSTLPVVHCKQLGASLSK